MSIDVRSEAVNLCIGEAAQAAAGNGLAPSVIEQFLRTGEKTWAGLGSGQFSWDEDAAYSRATKAALRSLFRHLGDLLPSEARVAPAVAPEEIRRRVEPMVEGMVQSDWREVALRELTARTFVLNFSGAAAALETELSSGVVGVDETGWRIVWACFSDFGLKPDDIDTACDGVASNFAHVRWSAYLTEDPYSDVVVHEAAHLLHYLKPRHYGLHTGRRQERFVDVDLPHYEQFAYACEAYSRVVQQGDRKSRIAFAGRMPEGAFSFPRKELNVVAPLVIRAAAARNGWRVLRQATEIQRITRRVTGQPGSAVRESCACCDDQPEVL